MDVREHPNQDGYIITMTDGTEYATQEGDRFYEAAREAFEGEEIMNDPA
jgi:hypothetical protein